MTEARLVQGEDGVSRCWWADDPPEYRVYHDLEWGRAEASDDRLFEKLALEGFQSGLSWLTILRKREGFREAFAGFSIPAVARFTERDVARLVKNPAIVRHQGKIRATISNARRAQETIEAEGSLAVYLWSFAPRQDPGPQPELPFTGASTELSRELKQRGWSYVGPTTVHAFMQAMGLVNDHLVGCTAREACADARRALLARLDG